MGGKLQVLKAEAKGFKSKAYALSTQKTYRSQIKKFLQFCIDYDCVPVPASQDTIVCYVAFLASSLNPSSIGGYLNGICM